MGRNFGGYKDPEFSGWEREIETQIFFTQGPQSVEGRTLFLAFGMRKENGVMTKLILQPWLYPILRISTLPHCLAELKKSPA